MSSSFFVNSASLFMLSAIIEKNKINLNSGEITCVNMPPGLIEGFESFVLFSLMILFPFYLVNIILKKKFIFYFFAIGVSISIIQRVYWAYNSLR